MNRLLQNTLVILTGLLLFSACTDQKRGEAPKKIAERLDHHPQQVTQDTFSIDTVRAEKPIAPVAPKPPSPKPDPPGPDPDPWPDPKPIIGPNPQPIIPHPEPINPIVDFPDVDPQYSGGEEALFKFITTNLQYPQIDKEMGNQGRVYVEFVVEKDGSLTHLKVLRGVSRTLDEEAKRIVRLMPNWTPGEVNGKVVRTKSRLPITFRLD